MAETFTFRRVGTSGCEILADGKVVAWTTNGYWAAIIVAVLDGAEHGGSHAPAACMRRPADDGQQHLSP